MNIIIDGLDGFFSALMHELSEDDLENTGLTAENSGEGSHFTSHPVLMITASVQVITATRADSFSFRSCINNLF